MDVLRVVFYPLFQYSRSSIIYHFSIKLDTLAAYTYLQQPVRSREEEEKRGESPNSYFIGLL